MKNGTRFVWAFVLVQFCWGTTTSTIKINFEKNNPLIWDGTDNFGQKVSAGLYLANIEDIDKRKSFKIVFNSVRAIDI